jgi:hypothetical protein
VKEKTEKKDEARLKKRTRKHEKNVRKRQKKD